MGKFWLKVKRAKVKTKVYKVTYMKDGQIDVDFVEGQLRIDALKQVNGEVLEVEEYKPKPSS